MLFIIPDLVLILNQSFGGHILRLKHRKCYICHGLAILNNIFLDYSFHSQNCTLFVNQNIFFDILLIIVFV